MDKFNLYKLQEGNVIDTTYFEELDLFVSRLAGEIDKKEVKLWDKSLQDILQKEVKKAKFQLLLDLRGFDPKSEEVYQLWLNTLLKMKVIEKQCIKITFVHHDSTKMFKMLIHQDDEKSFFDDIEVAFNWFKKRESYAK